MRTVLALALLATTLAVGGSSAAPFAQCVVFDKPEELYSHSDVVFRGTVIGKRPTGNQGFHVIVDVATFRVDQTWKGQPGPQVEVGADRPFKWTSSILSLQAASLCRLQYFAEVQNYSARQKRSSTGSPSACGGLATRCSRRAARKPG